MEGVYKLRTVFRVTFLTIILLFIMFYYQTVPKNYNVPLTDENHATPPKVDNQMLINHIVDTSRPKEGLSVYIGKNVHELINDFGNPQRKDLSAFGYEWWVYKKLPSTYMQVGVILDKVVTIYVIGEQLNVSPYSIGQPVEEIYRTTIFDTEITVATDEGIYRFELSEEDLHIRPLVQLGDIYVQLFIDKHTGTLFSLRFFDKNTLIVHRPYELVYRGELVEQEELSDEERRLVERGIERQIYDITNVIRKKFRLPNLQWDEKLSHLAYEHSEKMALSLYSIEKQLDTSMESDILEEEAEEGIDEEISLEERLRLENISFKSAAKNVAVEYVDAPAVVQGWLNSEKHRKTILNENFSKLGVGVYKKFYTQHFIE